ncbi:MAG: hypothetical protein KDE03_05735 [Rhodobacteraceae bacterium]|nr:hypothetical protein [Paracoccaceae bacterium]
MTIPNELIDRLSSETGLRMTERARQGRRRALATISGFCVTVTTNGQSTQDVLFDAVPTIGQIAARVGPDAFIVSVAMKRRPLRERLRLALAAE